MGGFAEHRICVCAGWANDYIWHQGAFPSEVWQTTVYVVLHIGFEISGFPKEVWFITNLQSDLSGVQDCEDGT